MPKPTLFLIKSIEIQAGDEKQELTAETIVINTGAVSNVLPIPGLATSKNVFDSTGIQNLDKLPENLVSLVAEISVLNLLVFTTNLEQGYSPRCLGYFPTSSRTFHRSSC